MKKIHENNRRDVVRGQMTLGNKRRSLDSQRKEKKPRDPCKLSENFSRDYSFCSFPESGGSINLNRSPSRPRPPPPGYRFGNEPVHLPSPAVVPPYVSRGCCLVYEQDNNSRKECAHRAIGNEVISHGK